MDPGRQRRSHIGVGERDVTLLVLRPGGPSDIIHQGLYEVKAVSEGIPPGVSTRDSHVDEKDGTVNLLPTLDLGSQEMGLKDFPPLREKAVGLLRRTRVEDKIGNLQRGVNEVDLKD